MERAWIPWLACGVVTACAGAEEPARVELPVVCDASALEAPVLSDLGYSIRLTEARVVAKDLTFSIAGEVHEASAASLLSEWLLPRARAHPGHFQGGEVTGELPGRFVLAWMPKASDTPGRATLLEGAYESANLVFARGQAEDGLEADDPLIGHTALLRGQAQGDGRSIDFVAVLDSPEDRMLAGLPFEHEVHEDDTSTLGLRLLAEDPFEGDTLFDGIDFEALVAEGGRSVRLDAASTGDVEAAYNLLRRRLQTHDHFDVVVAD